MPDRQVLDGPLDSFVDLLANSATFQTLVSAGDADEAKNSIYKLVAQDDGTEPRPRAIVDVNDDHQLQRQSTTGYIGSGTLFVDIEESTTKANAISDLRTFNSTITDLIDDLKSLSGTSGLLNANDIRIPVPPSRANPDLNYSEHYLVATLQVTYRG